MELLFGRRIRRERNLARQRHIYRTYPREGRFKPSLWAVGTHAYYLASDPDNTTGFSGTAAWLARGEMPRAFRRFKKCKHISANRIPIPSWLEQAEENALGPALAFSDSFEASSRGAGFPGRKPQGLPPRRYRLVSQLRGWNRDYAVNSCYLEAVHRVCGQRRGAWRETKIGDLDALAFFSPHEELLGVVSASYDETLEESARIAGILPPES